MSNISDLFSIALQTYHMLIRNVHIEEDQVEESFQDFLPIGGNTAVELV